MRGRMPARTMLRPGGAFLVYQFSAKARDFMARRFARISSGFELLNVLPCKLFWGWKDAVPAASVAAAAVPEKASAAA